MDRESSRRREMRRTLMGVLVGVGILATLLSRIDLQQLSIALWGVHVSLFVVSLGVRVLPEFAEHRHTAHR